jgi:hypothetical protein
MSVGVGQLQLSRALKDFKQRWAQSRGQWDDAAAEKFEEEFVRPLDQQVSQAIAAIGRMAEMLAAAKRDCE